MNVSFNLGALAKTKWYEYLVRFAFGGAITVTARFLAEHFGPVFGDSSWPFPLFFPQAPRWSQNTKPRRNRMRESQPTREGVKPLRWTQPERHWEALAWLLSR